jgi:hypothetical protein
MAKHTLHAIAQKPDKKLENIHLYANPKNF